VELGRHEFADSATVMPLEDSIMDDIILECGRMAAMMRTARRLLWMKITDAVSASPAALEERLPRDSSPSYIKQVLQNRRGRFPRNPFVVSKYFT